MTALLCAAHAIAQGIGAADFWQPCFAEGYTSAVCMWLQYEAPMPGWMYLGYLWLVEVGLAIAVLVAATRAGRAVRTAVVALIVVVLSNPITDYGFAPVLNGGYTSADAAPAFGYLGAGLIAVAAVHYAVIAVLGGKAKSRTSDISGGAPSRI